MTIQDYALQDNDTHTPAGEALGESIWLLSLMDAQGCKTQACYTPANRLSEVSL